MVVIQKNARERMIIVRKKKIGQSMWVMECPKCGKICAGAPQKSWLPDCTTCNCDKNE